MGGYRRPTNVSDALPSMAVEPHRVVAGGTRPLSPRGRYHHPGEHRRRAAAAGFRRLEARRSPPRARCHLVISIAPVAVVIAADPADIGTDARIAVGASSAMPLPCPGGFSSSRRRLVEAAHLTARSPSADLRAAATGARIDRAPVLPHRLHRARRAPRNEK